MSPLSASNSQFWSGSVNDVEPDVETTTTVSSGVLRISTARVPSWDSPASENVSLVPGNAAFPVVCRLVDHPFFAYAAHEFLRDHPPRSRCLAEYGGGFPDFLAAFEPCSSLPYLADVARFEWAIKLAAIRRERSRTRPAMVPNEVSVISSAQHTAAAIRTM